jgi:ABC-type glycerol-3-phosphate transport system substrate-binding protein
MKSSFQTFILAAFIIGFVVAIAVFSGLFSSGTTKTSTEPSGHVVVWGVLPRQVISTYINDFNISGKGYTVEYEEHDPTRISQELIVALANNNPPDIILFSSEVFAQFQNKLYTIPFAAYSERAYRDTYVDGAQLFLTSEGLVGLPLLVDPLVMYYNKDILVSQHYVVPPTTWTGLSQAVPLFTKRNAQNAITQSTIGLGDANNVMHMRDIISALFLQTGNQVIGYDQNTKQTIVTLGSSGEVSAAEALTFYTSFANPTNTNYSWNRSLPSSLDQFLAGKSAFYIGRASELFTIQAQNPNLNFDVMELLQLDNAPRPVTYGSFIAAGILKNAPNFTAAYTFASQLNTSETIDKLSKNASIPPARRDLLLVQQQNPYVQVFFKAALSAFSWPDPNMATTEQVFRAMITNVQSGKNDPQSAIYEAARNLQASMQ